jgi:trimeric autotransporter adhesin
MKNIDTFIGFSISKRGLLATVLPFLYVVALVAQPNNMSVNQDVSGTYANTPMTAIGGAFQARFKEGTGQATGTRNWQFNSDGYSNTWGARTAATLTSYNSVISPSTATASANWANSCSPSCYNAFGKLPATTTNYYYTYNILKGSSYASQYMAVLETSYSPVTVSTVTQASGTYGSRTINITTSATPNSGEYIFVRYSTNSYSNSTLVQATGSGTAWTATIPWQSGAVSFYVYTSNRTLAVINTDVTDNASNGQSVHDMSTLNLNNNSGVNYSWTPVTGAIIVSSTGGSFASPIGYASLTNTSGAFAALNSATSGTGAVTVLITADVSNEASSKSLNASTNWTSMTISPSGARTISGATTTALIELNGADNVTIDGLNTGGNTLTISNTSTASATSTIRFVGGATTNTLTNCTILGASLSPAGNTGGTIFFSTDAVTTTGNDNNTVSNCNIRPVGSTLPTKGIYGSGSIGTTAVNNSGITISNNNIYDYFGVDVASAGIYIDNGNTDWTISNNKFYQTATRTQTTGSQHSALWIANTTSGNNFSITGNTIGYSTFSGTGSYTLVGVSGTSFAPIYLSLASSGTASSVQNNTIAGIAMSGTQSGTTTSAPITCIDVKSGLVNIGDVTGNTIGSASATGSITYTSSATAGSDVFGIYVETGSSDMTISKNTIGGITVANSNTGTANIYGIRLSTTGTVTCQNNTIGGTIANSLQSTSTANAFINGIYNSGAAATISGNTIRNIAAAGGTGVRDLAPVIGISSVASTTNTISQNTIYNLSNSFVGATVITGIYIGGGTANAVSRNNIHSLTAANTSTASTLNGINTAVGTTTFSNNIIRLGIDGTATSITTGMTINGIYEEGGTNNFYYNTVYVGGNNVTGSAVTSAFTSSGSVTRAYQNNIFQNARSNSGSGTGKHYAIKIASAMNLTINNNLYFANGTGGVLANFNGTEITDITAWRAATSQDANSISAMPVFSNATGDATAVNLHLTTGSGNNCSIKGAGATGTGITVDYDGDTRNATQPGIGADEFGVKVAVTAISGTTPACTSTLLTPTTTPTSGLTYTWGNPTTPIGSATSGTYTVTVTGSYNVTITETSSGCTASAASASAITINPRPSTAVLAGTATICNGSSTNLTTTITGGTSPYTVVYSGGTVNTYASGANIPVSPTITTNYTLTSVTDANGCTATTPSGTPSVTVTPLPTTVTVTGGGTVCGSTTLTASNGSSGTIYYQSATSNGTSIATPSTSQAISSSGTYYFRAQLSGCWGTQGSASVTVNPRPTVALASQVNDPCQVGVGSITVTITGGTSPYSVSACGNYISPSPLAPALITVPTVNTSTSSATVSNLQGNATYKLTVTDANTCSSQ